MLMRNRAASAPAIPLRELPSNPTYPKVRTPPQHQEDGESSASSGSPTECLPSPVDPDSDSSRAPSRSKWKIPGLVEFWTSTVSCEVDFHACRDHLALERTFLGYLRTSMTLAMIGTTVAQLFTITYHDTDFGYTTIGKPLAASCFALAIGTVFLGAVRSWRFQNAMIRGKALASGFEIHVIGLGVGLLLLVFFGFLLSLDLIKSSHPDLR